MCGRIRLLGRDFSALHMNLDARHLPPEFRGTLVEDPAEWARAEVEAERAAQR